MSKGQNVETCEGCSSAEPSAGSSRGGRGLCEGTQEIACGVDEQTGDVFLSLEACEISETSKFVWSKNYKEIGDCPRLTASVKGRTYGPLVSLSLSLSLSV